MCLPLGNSFKVTERVRKALCHQVEPKARMTLENLKLMGRCLAG